MKERQPLFIPDFSGHTSIALETAELLIKQGGVIILTPATRQLGFYEVPGLQVDGKKEDVRQFLKNYGIRIIPHTANEAPHSESSLNTRGKHGKLAGLEANMAFS